ncbi:hypothetical protein ABIB00_004059 [Bradyrhizobium sp. LB14.3]
MVAEGAKEQRKLEASADTCAFALGCEREWAAPSLIRSVARSAKEKRCRSFRTGLAETGFGDTDRPTGSGLPLARRAAVPSSIPAAVLVPPVAWDQATRDGTADDPHRTPAKDNRSSTPCLSSNACRARCTASGVLCRLGADYPPKPLIVTVCGLTSRSCCASATCSQPMIMLRGWNGGWERAGGERGHFPSLQRSPGRLAIPSQHATSRCKRKRPHLVMRWTTCS